jgi:N-acetylglutamate synthase-like GNAT family acetyltransferase
MPTAHQVIDLYRSAGLNRPLDDAARIEKMYADSNLVVTAWDGETLVGVSRALTDWCYCCYLSDLAVREEYKRQGIGKQLIALTKEKIGEQSMLLLLSAPGAMGYYPKVGFEKVENGFIVHRVR